MINIWKFRCDCASLENTVFNNEESFLETFSRMNYVDIIHIRFSFKHIEFVVLTDDGAHVIEVTNWDKFTAWYKSL